MSEAAAAGRLDADDVACAQHTRAFHRQLAPVQQVAAGQSRLTAADALRRARPPHADKREPAVLEHAQLAHDAVAAVMSALPTRAEPELMPFDPNGIRELE